MATASVQPVFAHDQFWVRRKILTLFSQQFHIYDPSNNLLGFCKQKAFKLKEDIRIYADEGMSRELISIKARSIIDLGVTLDVNDSTSGQRVGSLRRKGLKSTFLRDEWRIFDANEAEIGTIQEDSMLLGLLRRNVTNLIPQTYDFHFNGREIGKAKQNFNIFVPKMHVDFSGDQARQFDRRLGLAAVILLMAIEGRQG
jgi:uncharacterized protein YxjI